LKQGIRQIRLNDPQVIKLRLKEFIGKNVNLVFHDRKSITGNVQTIDASGVELLNMRLKKMHFPFDTIAEVYFDIIV
jgi:ribosome maturation factor RimP